jgi:hypothetical protein
LKLRLIEQMLRAARDDRRRIVRPHGIGERAADRRSEIVRYPRIACDACDVGGRNLAHRLPGKIDVEAIRETCEIVGFHFGRVLERHLRGNAERRHDDRETAAIGEPEELDVTERLRIAHGCDDERDVARELAEEFRRVLDRVVELATRGAEFILDAALLVRLQRLRAHQLVDVRAVPGVGGNAAGRRMWLNEVSLSLEFRHLVADRRRTHAELVLLRERVRADRFGRRDILVDDRRQDEGLAFVEIRWELAFFR